MKRKVVVTHRWLEPPPISRNGQPIPKNQWPCKRKRSWVVRWFTTDGKRRQRSFKTRVEAEEFAAARQAEFDRNSAARRIPKRITLDEFSDEIVNLGIGPRGQHLSPASVNETRMTLNKLAAFVGGDVQLAEITAADAARFMARLKKMSHARCPDRKLSPATVNKVKRTVKAAFNIAVRQLGYLVANPFDGQSQDRLSDKPVRYVPPSEFAEVLQACGELFDAERSLWWRTLLTILYCGGLRVNEAIHLTWADVDFENEQVQVIAREGVLKFQPKGKKSRIIPLPKRAMDFLAKLQAEQSEEGNPYVFVNTARLRLIQSARQVNQWSETRETVNNLRRVWYHIVAASGVGRATMHDFRRSAITNWARALPVHVTQRLAGHANVQTTLRYYVAVLDADMDAARQVAEDALEKAAGRTQDAVGGF